MEINKSINQGKIYWGVMPLPAGAELIGTVTHDHQTGALIRLSTGIYVQGNAGGIRALDQHAITAAAEESVTIL